MYFDRRRQETDLILELQEENLFSQNDTGISIERKERISGIKETVIIIENESGARTVNRPIGTYVTIENKNFYKNDGEFHKEMSQILASHLSIFLGEFRKVLVVGLGNRNVISDALGPMVTDHLLVTGEIAFDDWTPALNLTTFSPGVLAQTGMETATLIHSLVQEFHPEMLFVIDSLAAKDPQRLNTTIQICDTGLEPGSGIGNHRQAITEQTMGIPVISIGVPTVIAVSTLISNFFKEDEMPPEHFLKTLDKQWLNLFVTPKEIDETLHRISYTISEGINLLHRKLSI